MPYAIRLPDGTLVENIPDDLDPKEAKRKLIAAGIVKGPETSIAGQVKEFAKGIPAGAVNLLETAGVGAANLLPQEQEDSAKKAIREFATAVKQPFTPSEGYEDTVGRKLGEGLGSTAPFFALGPLGLAGKAAATGLAAASGAGEASERAAAKGATQGQQTAATALGTVVGLSEMAPVFKFLDNLSTPIKEGILNRVRRAAVTGGAEGAQEAAAQVAQNLIAKGIYDPNQEIVQGSGEAGAYGFGVGALIQGITDMALGRKGGSGVSSGTTIEEARRKAREKEQAQQPQQPQSYLTDAQLAELAAQPNGYGELERYKQRLLTNPKSEQNKEALKRVAAMQRQMNIEQVNRIRPGAQQDSAFTDTDPDLFGMYYPEQSTPTGEIPTEEQAVASPQQQVLDFTPEGGTAPLFPEIGYEAPQQDFSAALSETSQEVITEDLLRRLGVQPKQPIYKRLLGKRLDRTSELEYVKQELEKYLEKGYGSNELRASLDGYFQNLVALSAPTKELNFNQPRVRQKGQRDTVQPANTATTGEASTGASAAPNQQSVGVDSQSNVQPTTIQPDATGVDVSERASTTGNGAVSTEQPALTGTDTRVRNVEASAVDYQRSITPDIQAKIDSVEREKSTRNELLRERKAVIDSIKELHDKNGVPLPDTEQARASAAQQLSAIQENIKNQDRVLKSLKAEISEAEALESSKWGRDYFDSIGTSADRETVNEVKQKIDQAVGAYNNPGSTDNRRKISIGYLMDTLGYYSAKDKATGEDLYTKPGDKYKRQRYDYALNALAYGVDIKSFTPKQRTNVLKALGIDKLEFEAKKPAEQRKAIEAAADAQLKGEAQKWGDQLFQKETTARNTEEEQLDIYLELRGKNNPIDVADWLASTAPNREYRRIATRVAARMRAMQARGTTFKFSVANVLPGVLGRVDNFVGEETGKVTTWVSIRGFGSQTTGKHESNGLNYETILHELVHAATSAAVRSSLNMPIRNRLEALLDHAKKNVTAERNELENIDELLAWGLTNPEFRLRLESVPYKGGSLISKIVEYIREFLGLPAKADTALTELLTLSEEVFETDVNKDVGAPGRFNQIATPETEAVDALDVIGEQERKGFLGQAAGELGTNKVTGIRVKLADSLAALDDIFTRAWRGAVRDTEGVLNPIVLLSRALDSLRVSKAVQEVGGLEKVDDLFVAAELTIPEGSTQFPLIAGQNVSYQSVIKKIADEAKTSGRTYEQVRKIVDSVLYGRREYELRQAEAQGSGPFEYLLTAEQAAQANAAFQANTDIQEISQALDAIRFNLIDAMVEAGRISTEHADTWKEASGYVPFRRLSDEDVISSFNKSYGRNKGAAALRNIKRFEGSEERKSTSVVENFSGLVDYMTGEAMRNDAARQSLEALEQLNYARRVPTPDVIDKDRRTKVISIYRDGRRTHYYVEDPSLVVGFSLQPPAVSNILKGFQKASQVLRAGVTAAPPFAVKQVFDDIVRAYTYAGVRNPGELTGRILTGFLGNWYNEAFGKKSAGVKELERLGIIGTFDFTESSNLKNILEESGATKRGIGASILRFMEAGAKASDVTVREAIYKQVLKETGSIAEAESRAREIINFSRRGSSKMMDYMVRIVPFFNAYARGMDKLATAAAGNMVGVSTGVARSMFYQRMAVLTAMGLTYAILMSDDDEYNALPDHVRDQNWILPYGKELGFTPSIPIAPELAFFFKAIPERVVQYYRLAGTDEERATMQVIKELMVRGVDVFSSPNVTPQLLKPILENMANYSFFLGRPLESQSQVANLRPFERYGTGTSEIAKFTAAGLEQVANTTGVDLFAISPIKIENLIRGLLGTTAGTVLAFTDVIMNPTRTDRPMHSNLYAQITGASALMKDRIGTRYLDELYSLDMAVEQVFGTYNRKLQSDPEDAVQFLEDNIGMFSIRDMVNTYMESVKNLNSISMMVDKDASMSSAEKRKIVDELKEYQVQLARDVFRLRKMAADIQAQS